MVTQHIPGAETLYRVGKNDIGKAQKVLAQAFAEDPFVASLFEDKQAEPQRAELLQKFSLECAIKYGHVYASSADMEGIIILYAPEKMFMSDWEYLQLGVLSLKKKIHKNIVKLMDEYGGYSKQLHQQYATIPHWYLYEIGVSPEHRGEHVATKLLTPFLEYFDSQQLGCYLETHNEKNVGLYAHYGFDVVVEGKLPGTEKPQWCMLRPPKR